jgi:membrane protein required for beta-lactamase induction
MCRSPCASILYATVSHEKMCVGRPDVSKIKLSYGLLVFNAFRFYLPNLFFFIFNYFIYNF